MTEALDLPPATPAEVVQPVADSSSSRGTTASPRDRSRPPPGARFGDRPLKLSFGQINDYLECPARYRYGARRPHPDARSRTRWSTAARSTRPCRPSIGARWPAGRCRSTELHAALDASWESVGFLTREHEEARLAAAHEAVDALLGGRSSGTRRVRSRSSRTSRSPSGRIGSAVATTGSTATTTGRVVDHRLQVERRPRPRHGQPPRAGVAPAVDLRPRARGRARGRCRTSWRSTSSSRASSAAAEPTEKRLAKAQETLATVADGIRAGRFERDALARCAAATARSARSAPTPRDERAPPRDRRRPLPARRSWRWSSSSRSPATPARSRPTQQPCPDAARNLVIGIGLAALAVGLLVTPFAFLGEFVARRRIVYRGAWARAARRGLLAGLVVAVLAGLRLGRRAERPDRALRPDPGRRRSSGSSARLDTDT